MLRRQEDIRRQQEAELGEQKRQLDESQDRIRREAEVARCVNPNPAISSL